MELLTAGRVGESKAIRILERDIWKDSKSKFQLIADWGQIADVQENFWWSTQTATKYS